MAQPATNPKVEELRFRLKTDPKSRLFFPLAEELRKIDQLAEAEQVLRSGLTNHPTYLSAWVSLGRVLHEQTKDADAVEALSKAVQLDPGNVVAARLLGDAHLALGDKVEAIKKYKLVRALLPADEELDATIEKLDRELSQAPLETVPEPAASPFVSEEPFASPVSRQEPAGMAAEVLPFAPAQEAVQEAARPQPTPFAPEEPSVPTAAEPFSETSPFGKVFAPPPAEGPWALDESRVFAEAEGRTEAEQKVEREPGDIHLMGAAQAPAATEPPLETPPLDAAEVFAPASEEPFASATEAPAGAAEDLTNTLTMADLYARQGLIDDARRIYENILQRDPDHAAVREKLDALAAPAPERTTDSAEHRKIDRLEKWLAKVGRREVSRV